MTAPLVHVVLGSTRQGRSGERVARWFLETAADRTDLRLELVDLRDWPLPFFDSPVPPITGRYDDPAQQAWAAKVAEADAYVLVSPEYNHGYTAVLKNALDTVFAEWGGKPVGFVGYGGPAGGVRAVEQLRQVVVELGMVPLREQVALARVYAAFDEDGRLRDPAPEVEARAVLDGVARALAAQASGGSSSSATEFMQ
jgi:NAD(P)H-dependent FMN reductase